MHLVADIADIVPILFVDFLIHVSNFFLHKDV